MRLLLVRTLVALSLALGTWYVGWRWLFSVNWHAWWIAVPLILAETYSLVDAYFFGLTVWRLKVRPAAPPPPPDGTVDVFITTVNEPVDLVIRTVVAALNITHPHQTWVLDDGDRPAMRAACRVLGAGYITRDASWADRPRHAKAGNLNSALLRTQGEFLLILDADQVPDPAILDRTLGWFEDPQVGLVQTPQWFSNVDDSDPLGSQAPLFYGPIQQGKDGWNAAFFCGSNALLRREALMQLGLVGYARDVEREVTAALRGSRRVLTDVGRGAPAGTALGAAIGSLDQASRQALSGLREGTPLAEVTHRFQREVDSASRQVVSADLAAIQADLAELTGGQVTPPDPVEQERILAVLAGREWSPLTSVAGIGDLVRSVDVGLPDEAQPIMPIATVSVTEDMATAMRLHALGWRSVYHHEVLASGLAPEDLATMLKQRLRWAQGTLQVFLRENPARQRGLSIGQRLMYTATMWSYLSGFAALAFLAAPIIYLCFGVLPVDSFGLGFLAHFLPFMIANQLLFFVVGYGVRTWRGHQYTLALFPLWIRASVTAFANVAFGRPLGFVVTQKSGLAEHRFPWRLVLPQVVATGLLVVAVVVGLIRLVEGSAPSTTGTLVNVAWVLYDLLVMSVIFRGAAYRGFQGEKQGV